MTWSLIVPVKRLPQAKSRLDPELTGIVRRDVALAFALDTVSAVLDTATVTRLIVVCSDPEVLDAMRGTAAEVLPEPAAGGLNPALRYGAAYARQGRPGAAVAGLPADLPALRPAELAAALRTAMGYPRTVVADSGGLGSTLLTAAAGTDLDPRYGPGSLLAHTSSGAVGLTGAWPGLRRDVDTAADLLAAEQLGVGAATRATLKKRSRAYPDGMQGTVWRFDAQTHTGSVLLDDGSAIDFGADAFAAGRLLLLRPGQRVRMESVRGVVSLITILTLD